MNVWLIAAMALILVPAITLAAWVTWDYQRDILFENKKTRKPVNLIHIKSTYF